jgi:hypothetical protein
MLNKLKNFNWTKNMFLVPILLVAGISISHVVSWYDMANPINWAIYLSIAIEIGAMTSLIAATKKIKGGVWFMFGLVTFIQMMGNIFYSYVEIDEMGDLFKNWVELTSPVFEMMGTDPTDIIPHKRWLALLEGGLLPLISLTALHFYIKYDDSGDVSPTNGGPSEGPSNGNHKGIPFPQEPTISTQPNNEPIEPLVPTEEETKNYWDENPDRELGKYDNKYGPEYTRMIDEVDKEMEADLVKEIIDDVKTGPMEIGESEDERQKHLKFRKRLIVDDEGKKTLIVPKRDKISQKIIKG